MAQHAILTNKSNQRIAAAIAASGLVGAGLAFPFAQASLANGVDVDGTCTISDDGASSTTLRTAIDAAIANTSCEVIVVNNTASAPLDLEVEGGPIYVGPSDSESDTRTSIRIESTTGLNIKPAAGYSLSLMELQDQNSWSSSSSLCLSVSNQPEDCTGMNSLLATITIEGLTFRDSEASAIDGLFFGNNLVDATLEIKNSRFVSNRSTSGGAIMTDSDISVSNSIFIGNDSFASQVGEGGGAVWTKGGAEISSSLFMNNETASDNYNNSYHGGAVYAEEDIKSVNSTYLGNDAKAGGALYAEGDVQLVLNTFDDNSSDDWGLHAFSQDDIFLWGNISSNHPGTYGFDYDDGYSDLNYNLFTSEADINVSLNNSRLVTFEELAFGEWPDDVALSALSTPVTTAPTLPIFSTSVAARFVTGSFPDDDFDDFFNDKISVDQLGTSRSSSVDAGAHQVSARRSSGGTAPVVVAPVVPKEAMVPGFAANSTKLTKPMKKEIRQFLKANPNLKNVVCKGYTSSPSTPQDRTLARKRGKATCDYILTLRPDAQVTIRSGSHTNKPGSQIRRVEIKLS